MLPFNAGRDSPWTSPDLNEPACFFNAERDGQGPRLTLIERPGPFMEDGTAQGLA